MGIAGKVLKYIKNPLLVIPYLGMRGCFNWMDDETYLKLVFRCKMGYWPDLKNPKTFNEKLQWLKLHNRKPEYTQLVDKYAVREYIARKIGRKYLVPLLGVWDTFDQIEFSKLPNQFVLKCTHDSGGLIVCRDKARLDINSAGKKISKCLKRNFYWGLREWPYKDVKPRIIAERYLNDNEHIVPKDYKVYCFDGEPRYIVVFHNRFNSKMELAETVYDTKWNVIPCSFDAHFTALDLNMPKPKQLKEILYITKKICKSFAHLRADYYLVNDRLYFGEITLTTASGLTHTVPNEWDRKLGDMICLSHEKR